MDLYQIQVTDSTIEGGSGVEKTDEASLSEEECDLQVQVSDKNGGLGAKKGLWNVQCITKMCTHQSCLLAVGLVHELVLTYQ